MDKESPASIKAETPGQIEAREHRVAEARKFNLLSNVFMRVAFRDKRACQYVLRVLTGIPDLIVKEVRTEYRVSKINSHDVVLDVLADDGNSQLYNIEIQRADTVDHAKRVRLYGAMIGGEYLAKGKTYADLPDLFIIYISETDIWKAGYTTYLVEKRFKNTDILYDDGLHIMYVNAAVNDGTKTAKLMQYFKVTNPNDMSHGDLSKRVHLLKCEEGGYLEMCEISERIFTEGRAEGRAGGELEKAKGMAIRLADMGGPVEKIAKAAKVTVDMVTQWLDNRTVTA